MKKAFIAGALFALAVPFISLAATVVLVTCSVTASQTTIYAGDPVTITWHSTNGTHTYLSTGTAGHGNHDVAANGTQTFYPKGTQPFYLNVLELVPHVGADFKQCGVMINVLYH